MGFLSAGVKGVSKIADNILKSIGDDPPFPSRKGSPFPPLTGDPRAAVVGAARREELIQKRKALAKKKRPVKDSVTESIKTKRRFEAREYGAANSALSKIDPAMSRGDITPMEAARQGRIIGSRYDRLSGKAKKPVKGSITKSVKTPIEGPKSRDVSNVDDLFGAGSTPMGYKYGSRK